MTYIISNQKCFELNCDEKISLNNNNILSTLEGKWVNVNQNNKYIIELKNIDSLFFPLNITENYQLLLNTIFFNSGIDKLSLNFNNFRIINVLDANNNVILDYKLEDSVIYYQGFFKVYYQAYIEAALLEYTLEENDAYMKFYSL